MPFFEQKRKKRKAVRRTDLKWTNNVMPYTFADGHFSTLIIPDISMVLRSPELCPLMTLITLIHIFNFYRSTRYNKAWIKRSWLKEMQICSENYYLVLHVVSDQIYYNIYFLYIATKDQYIIKTAMREWEKYTCIKFREKTNSDINYVRFQNGHGWVRYYT